MVKCRTYSASSRSRVRKEAVPANYLINLGDEKVEYEEADLLGYWIYRPFLPQFYRGIFSFADVGFGQYAQERYLLSMFLGGCGDLAVVWLEDPEKVGAGEERVRGKAILYHFKRGILVRLNSVGLLKKEL